MACGSGEHYRRRQGREGALHHRCRDDHPRHDQGEALTSRYLGRRSTRHEEASRLFGELLKQNKIPAKYAGLRNVLMRAVSEKSEYDYKGTEVGSRVAKRWTREARSFIDAVKEMLG